MSGRKRKKRPSMIKHASDRLAERYGIRLTMEMMGEMVRQIQSGESAFLEKQSHTRSVHAVLVGDRPVVVVYDPTRKCIRTALEIGMREEMADVSQHEPSDTDDSSCAAHV